MTAILTTDRLRLRPARLDDASWITHAVNDPGVYERVARIAPGQTEAAARAFLKTATEGALVGEDLVFAVEMKAAPVGMVGAHRSGEAAPFEIGYWLARPAWGRGVATEAAAGLKAWLRGAFGIRCLVSGYFADNPASGRVLRKLGFLPSGRGPVHCAGRGRQVDHVYMSWLA